MAVDNTQPRVRLIATLAVIAVITLVGLDFVLKSYFTLMSEGAQYEKMAPRADVLAQTASDSESFSSAKVPMLQAVAQLKLGRGAVIEPKPSDDLGAMTGWNKLPKVAPASFVAREQAPTGIAGLGHGAASSLADGGVASTNTNVDAGLDARAPGH